MSYVASLTEPVSRTVIGLCFLCGLAVFEDDAGEAYCEGCNQ